jgi:ribosome recycling factor
MPTKALIDDARTSMHASVEAEQRDLTAMSTGRATVAMLDGI